MFVKHTLISAYSLVNLYTVCIAQTDVTQKYPEVAK